MAKRFLPGRQTRLSPMTALFKAGREFPAVKGWVKSTLVLLLILFLTTVLFALVYRPLDREGVPDAPQRFFDVRISSSGLEPGEIRVAQGSVVTLNLTADGEDHHFGLTAFGVSPWVPAGETVQVRFQASLTGTFAIRCLILEPGHFDEQGMLVVIPSS